jgi:4-hydroxybutyryl-CoA dehydratase/vinylacetyl-CoA-Delta-isomerase
MAGAAIAIARANGLTQKAFQDKLTNIVMINNITIGLGIGAIMEGHDDGGAWIPDTALAHTNKVQVGTIPYEAKRLAVEIAGGIVETGCVPSYIDMMSPIYGEKLMKAMDAGSGAEDRIKLTRLMEWIHIGGGVPGCMHGGGSPDTARMLVKGATPWEKYVGYAKKIAGIPEDHLVEVKK